MLSKIPLYLSNSLVGTLSIQKEVNTSLTPVPVPVLVLILIPVLLPVV